jgi:16S rRNA (cytosine967-C5)-methyltransferase
MVGSDITARARAARGARIEAEMGRSRAPVKLRSAMSENDLAPRAAALDALAAALDRRNGLDEALSGPAFGRLSPLDRGFARALVMATLRRLGSLDALLQPKLRKAPPDAVIHILRLGAAELLLLDTPDHAAVDSAVRLVEQRVRPFKALVNGVLRGLARDRAAPGWSEPPPERDVPPWLFSRWRAAYGEEAVAIAAALRSEPPTDLTLREPSEAADLAEALEAEVLPSGSLRTRRGGSVAEWPGFGEGRWWVQDAAAALPARLLAVRPGETVLDLCAAPGGKTLQLAAAGGAVTALDRSEPRLRRLRENLTRTGLGAEVVAAPAETWADPRRFKAVLLDAPCSSTGTFRRNPDVLWAISPTDVSKLAGVQSRLLDAAADRTQPGGRLIYCVCSLEPEEGEGQVAAFLSRRPDFRLQPVEVGEAGSPKEAARDGALRLLPSMWAERGGMDGFYAARLVRG